jgi:hypothetical protein
VPPAGNAFVERIDLQNLSEQIEVGDAIDGL